MANVLPPEIKKLSDRTLRARLVLLLGTTLLLGALVAALSLIPAFVSVQFASSSLDEQAATPREMNDQVTAARFQALTIGLVPLATATSSPSGALAHALSLRPSGISVTNVSFTAGKMVLQGIALRRESVQEYRAALDADPRYTQVTVPVAALAGTQDGKFSVTLTGTF